jgi:hypothetical protein
MSITSKNHFWRAYVHEPMARKISIFTDKKCLHFSSRDSRVSQACRVDRLDNFDSNCENLSRKIAQTSNWPRTSISTAVGSASFNGDTWLQFSRCRRSHFLLCTCKIPLRPNGQRIRPRPCHDFRVHSDAGPARSGVNQQVNPSASGCRRILRSQQNDERHHSSRGQNSLSNRVWIDESIYVDCRQNGWQIKREIRRTQKRRKGCLVQGSRTTKELAFVCKGSRAEEQDRTENVSHSQRNSKEDCCDHRVRGRR